MMSRFKAGQEIPDGFLTVLEQMPGTIVWADVSDELKHGGTAMRFSTCLWLVWLVYGFIQTS